MTSFGQTPPNTQADASVVNRVRIEFCGVEDLDTRLLQDRAVVGSRGISRIRERSAPERIVTTTLLVKMQIELEQAHILML